MTKSLKRILKITGYESGEIIYERSLPPGALSDRQTGEVLARLAAKHLTEDEIVFSSIRRNMRSRQHHLEVTSMSAKRFGLTTNGNPYYTATEEDVVH
jgi:hypothetical protein